MDNHETIERTQRLLRDAFGRPRPLAEVGRKLGITGSRVRQIERRACLHLGRQLQAHLKP